MIREPRFRCGGWWWLTPSRPLLSDEEREAFDVMCGVDTSHVVSDAESASLFDAHLAPQGWPGMAAAIVGLGESPHFPCFAPGAYGAASIGFTSREEALAALEVAQRMQ